MTATGPTVNAETGAAFNAADRAERAHWRLVGRAVVLSRLAELMSVVAQPRSIKVDFGKVREEAFWQGMRELAEDIAEDADTMNAAITVLCRPDVKERAR